MVPGVIRTLSVAVLQTTFETVRGSVDRWVGGGGEHLTQRATRLDPPVCRVAGCRQRLQVGMDRGREHPLEGIRVVRPALLKEGEDRAPVVVDDHQGEVGPGFVRPDEQAGACLLYTSRCV